MTAEVTATIAEENLSSLGLHNVNPGGNGNLVKGDAFYNVYIIAQYASVDAANKAALKAEHLVCMRRVFEVLTDLCASWRFV